MKDYSICRFNNEEMLERELIRLKKNVRCINEKYGYIKDTIDDIVMRKDGIKFNKLENIKQIICDNMVIESSLLESYINLFVNNQLELLKSYIEDMELVFHPYNNTLGRFSSGYITESIISLYDSYDISNPTDFLLLLDEIGIYTVHNCYLDDFIERGYDIRSLNEIISRYISFSIRGFKEVNQDRLNNLINDILLDLIDINSILEINYTETNLQNFDYEIVELKNIWDLIDGINRNLVDDFIEFIATVNNLNYIEVILY